MPPTYCCAAKHLQSAGKAIGKTEAWEQVGNQGSSKNGPEFYLSQSPVGQIHRWGNVLERVCDDDREVDCPNWGICDMISPCG